MAGRWWYLAKDLVTSEPVNADSSSNTATTLTANTRDSSHEKDSPKLLQDAMATALSLDHWIAPDESLCNYSVRELSVNFLCMDDQETGAATPSDPVDSRNATSIPRAARFQEIFLDLIGWHASRNSSSRFLLDERFDSILSKDEKQLKGKILELIQTTEDNKSRAHDTFTSLLEQHFSFRKLNNGVQRRIKRLTEARSISRASNASNEAQQQKVDIPFNDANFLLKQIMNEIKKSGELRRAAASTDLKLSQLEEIESFLQEKLPSYNDRLLPSIQGATEEVRAEFERLFRIPSHVFVCNTSVCELACDVFLCPVAMVSTELHGNIWIQWSSYAEKNKKDLWSVLTKEGSLRYHHHPQYSRIAVIEDWPNTTTHPLVLPTEVVYLGDDTSERCAYRSKEHVNQLMESARQFLHAAYDLLKDKPPLNRRERHLFAVPVVGTGGAGAVDLTGEIVRNLLKVIHEFVADHRVDCVLVAADGTTYAHAQSVREEPKSILSCEKRQSAVELANLAASGQLSLFLGAGTSIASGLPTWIELLNEIEDFFTPTGAKGERSIGDDCNWDPLKMADTLERVADVQSDRSGLVYPLKERVVSLLDETKYHPSLILTLLISLPSKSIVTTNYDKLIETAYRNRNVIEQRKVELSVLPHQPLPGAKEWLLKMHGCVSHPKRIVLSGRDYKQRKILSGIVQANLLTAHLLFCGFSLTDPNYLKIISEVRSALYPDDDEEEEETATPVPFI